MLKAEDNYSTASISNDLEQPSMSYQVIRRFVLSKGFESSFGLELLANILNEIIQGRRPNQLTFGLSGGMKEDKECPKSKPASRMEGDFHLPSEANADPPQPKLLLTDQESESKSDVSDSTVLYNMDASRENHVKKSDCDTNKNDFFSSDFDESSSSLEETVSKSGTQKKGKSGKEWEKKEKKCAEGFEAEEKELEKLLRMTDINPCNRPNSPSSEEEEGEKKQKENTKSKQKEEVSLMDCLDVENINNSEPYLKNEEEEEKNGKDFFSTVNSQIKKTFLLSSDESAGQSSEEVENELESVKTEEEKETKEKPNGNKRRKDDLSEFRIPNFSQGEENLKDEINKDSTGEDPSRRDEAVSDETSDNSVKCVHFVKKKKRELGKYSEQTTDSDSGSDIQQVFCKTEFSPTKGRKNIKKILKKGSLQVETKQALKMETERKKRVSERQKLFEKLYPDADKSLKLVLDFDPQTKEELVVVDEKLARLLKPHQKDGVRFMWNCCFESLKRLEEDSGSGCVLAHCMGLGKTLQVISLVHTIFTHNTGVQTVLIMCPLNTIRNWIHEFKKWQRHCLKEIKPVDLIPCKSQQSRTGKVRMWSRKGGVLIISYEMFRSLINKSKNKYSILAQAFLDPGPDLVVCDEGHVLKNNSSALSKCISQIKTLRRIILTGTPLQNNLTEYYCMVQFVKPNILGTMKEFKNRFVHPINNGQFEDSTQWDVRLMKRRAHVLHAMLEGFVQRFGYYVLTPFLPEKQEYVISIALTDTQELMYRFFIDRCNQDSRGLLKDFHWLQKIWTHPRVLMMHAMKQGMELVCTKFFQKEDYEEIRSGGKLVLLFDILKLSKLIGDKVLVFSQSLLSLDLIEFFLRKGNNEYSRGCQSEIADSWEFGKDYFRLDGSTNSENRDMFCQKFNNVEDKRSRLFLVSTKAGGLGINLVAANRVIVFDASWNPTHDVQSIFRVYRFGQKKPCFIYRFLAAATMEEKIYRRQVTKLSLAHRILDEHQIERHYTMGNLQELYRYDPIPRCEWRVPKIPKDNVFADLLPIRRDIIVAYHEHDSLLENKEEEELSEEERRAAWEDFEKEKLSPEYGQQLNGHSLPPLLNQVNKESFKVLGHQSGVVAPENCPSTYQTENQMCKIVNVRTLRSVGSVYHEVEASRLLELGQSFGMKPFANESSDEYRTRVGDTLQRILPWGMPEGVVQGSENSVNRN